MGEAAGESSKKRKRRKRSKRSAAADEENTAAASDNEAATTQNDEGDGVVDSAKPAAAANDDDDDAVAGGGADREQNEDGGDDEIPAKEPKKRKRKRNRKKKSDSAADGEAEDGKPSESDAAKLASVEHTVFIEGLPFTSTPEEVRSFFVQHGCEGILQLRLPTWQDTGRLRGFGHVVFASKEARARALGDEVNGKTLGGRYVTVKDANAPRAGTAAGAALGGAKPREQPPGCSTVFVRNLPYDAAEGEIEDAFRVCGKIVEGGVRVARNHVNGRSKGFAYVQFKNEEAARVAVEKAAKPFGMVVMERPVFVDYDEGAVKGSFRDGQGKLWSKGQYGDNGGGGGGRGGRGRRGGGPGFGMRGAR